MSTTKPTAAESAQWHQGIAQAWRTMATATDDEAYAERAAHAENAAEALDLLAEIANRSQRDMADPVFTVEQSRRLWALVEGR